MRATLATVDDIPGGAQITIFQTFECEGAEKPVCVAESLARVYVGTWRGAALAGQRSASGAAAAT